MLSSNQKGAIAEMAIALEASRRGITVMRPMTEGTRYDLVFDVGSRLLRVQCKWARCKDGVIGVQIAGSYHSPVRGYVRSSYAPHEVDAIAVYCPELDACYLVPIDRVAAKNTIFLRVRPTRNNQRGAVNMAQDFGFGAVAQLEERRHGMAEATGSSPVSSISSPDDVSRPGGERVVGCDQFRTRFGYWLDRAAAGEEISITRRGRPYARLLPPQDQLAAEPTLPPAA